MFNQTKTPLFKISYDWPRGNRSKSRGRETLRMGVAKCRDYIFVFLCNPSVLHDNNTSERDKYQGKTKSLRPV